MSEPQPYAMPVDAAAQFCGVSRNTLLREVNAGNAPAPVRIRGKKVWRRPDLERWLDSLKPEGAAYEADPWDCYGTGPNAVSEGLPGPR